MAEFESGQTMEVDVPKRSVNHTQAKPVVFGQLIIGPPGSGKSTFCKTMLDVLTKLGISKS
jgi:Mg-chelatase subunit ChlI